MALPITNPNVSTYASRVPYLTPAEYLASPTGVDVSQLVVAGSDALNSDALTQTIARASSWIDTFCNKVLAATLDTQTGRFRVQRDGTIKVPVANTPIVEVIDVQIGTHPSSRRSLDDISDVWIGPKVVTVPVGYGRYNPQPPASEVFAVVSYVNGFAHCLLRSVSFMGDVTVTVDNPLGIVPGMQLTVYDPGKTETIYVMAVDGNIITLMSALAFDHAVGVNVSALPPAIKQAAVLKTSALIKTRSDDAWIMPTMGSEPTKQSTNPAGNDDQIATELLMPYRRVQ